MALPEQPAYLVGFAESLPTPEVCFSLRSTGAHIVCFFRAEAQERFVRLSFVHYVPVSSPEKNISRAIEDVQSVVAEFAPQLVAACDDSALLIFSRMVGSVSQGIVPCGNRFTFAFDKWKQIAAAQASGYATIQTQLVDSPDDASQFPIRPAVLKPRFALDISGDGASKGHAFTMQNDFLSPQARAAISQRPYLIQEFRVGVGEGFFGVAHKGEILAQFGHRRLRMMNPAGSGASACIARVPELAEIEKARTLILKEAWTGPFMIEQLRDSAGRSWFMEFNGRFWGSVALARRCGLDIPRLAFEIASGKEPHIPSPRKVGFARHLGRDLVYLLFVLRGPREGYPSHAWPSRLSSMKAVLLPNRLESFYNYDPSEPLFFLKDAAMTVKNAMGRKVR